MELSVRLKGLGCGKCRASRRCKLCQSQDVVLYINSTYGKCKKSSGLSENGWTLLLLACVFVPRTDVQDGSKQTATPAQLIANSVAGTKAGTAMRGTPGDTQSAASTLAKMDDMINSAVNQQTKEEASGSSFSGIWKLLLAAVLISAAVMATPKGRNALITAGLISADSEFTKMSLKASSDATSVASRLSSFPMVQQAMAAMGCLYQGGSLHEDEVEMNKPLIDESDGDSEDEAELTVNLKAVSTPKQYGSLLSCPKRNTEKKQDKNDDFNPNSPAAVPMKNVADVGSAPLEQDTLQHEHHDDFFDEDDDF